MRAFWRLWDKRFDYTFIYDIYIRYAEQLPVYITLHDTRNNDTVVCRELIPGVENESRFNDVIYFSGGLMKVIKIPCLLLLRAKSMDEADRIIKSYQKGIDQINKIAVGLRP